MFDHAISPKKGRTSIEYLKNQTIKKIIEDALFQVPDETEEKPPSVSKTTTDNRKIGNTPLITLLK